MKRPFSINQISVHDSHLGKFNTYSGAEIDLLQPDEKDIHIDDIGHALSNICRFGGHSDLFYSVAQHSVLVAALAPQSLKLVALLHDAPEAYLGDIISPLKKLLGHHYTQFEAVFELVIGNKFGFDYHDLKAVREFDRLALEIENEALKHNDQHRLLEVLGANNLLTRGWAWTPPNAELEFLEAFQELYHPSEAPAPVLIER